MDEQTKNISNFVDANREEMIDLWKTLVNIESGSHNKKGIDTIVNKLKTILEDENFKTDILDFKNAGASLIAKSTYENSKKPICLTGHMDTVFKDGAIEKNPFKIENGKVYGPGVVDMKGGIVVLIYAIKALNSINYKKRPIKVILIGDEEVGHANSSLSELLPEEFKECYATFNCETGRTDNAIVTERKGCASFILEVRGIAAHAGNQYEEGKNAVLEISHKIIDIQNLTNIAEGTTLNVGIVNGGTAGNVVPEHAEAMIDVRFLKEDMLPKIAKELEKIAKKTYVEGTKSELKLESVMHPMEIINGTKELFEVVRKTSLELDLKEPYGKTVGGGSDSSFSTMVGVPALCGMGAQGMYQHTNNEFGYLESLFERTKLLASSILNL